jgi:hypothetical protein
MTKVRDMGSGRPLVDRLGVRPGMRIALVRFEDPAFEAELRERGAEILPTTPSLDLVFYLVQESAELDRPAELRQFIKDSGAIWVLRRKGSDRTVREEDIIAAGRAFDLIDNKIASFSDALAAMRLVVPLASREASRLPICGRH